MADAVHDLCDSHKLKETAEDYIDIHAIESRVLPRIHPSQALSDQLSIANGASASKRRFWNPRIQIALEQFGSSAKTEAVFGSR